MPATMPLAGDVLVAGVQVVVLVRIVVGDDMVLVGVTIFDVPIVLVLAVDPDVAGVPEAASGTFLERPLNLDWSRVWLGRDKLHVP